MFKSDPKRMTENMWETNVCCIKPEVSYKKHIYFSQNSVMSTHNICDALWCAQMKHQIMILSMWIKPLTYLSNTICKRSNCGFERSSGSYPGMPMAPMAWERGTSWGQSTKTLLRSLPSDTVCVLQPHRPTTWQPTGNEGLLLWITLWSK